MEFTKYEAAGNSYIIVNQDRFQLTPASAIKCCSTVYGAGGDGIITWQKLNELGHVAVTIFNPDGSTAEKSGNGLRILATFLFTHIFKDLSSLTLSTLGGEVTATQLPDNSQNQILLEMGKVTCQFEQKGLSDSPTFHQGSEIKTEIGAVFGHAVSIGNPHFVIFDDELAVKRVQELGPYIENHAIFPNRTNVQFVKIVDTENISAEIWERGAGYTLSSGSSSCAIAAVAYQLGKCGPKVTVSMPGGQLQVEISKNGTIWLTGPVNKTVEGVFNH
ncbi:MAG: diaminopimelate epimerase [Anaerolineae bacterium]